MMEERRAKTLNCRRSYTRFIKFILILETHTFFSFTTIFYQFLIKALINIWIYMTFYGPVSVFMDFADSLLLVL